MARDGGTERTPEQVEHDLALIARLWLSGNHNQTEIGIAVGLSQQQVGRELKKLQKQWQDSAQRDFAAAKGEILAQIDLMWATYWEAFQDSKKNTIRVTQTSEINDISFEDWANRMKALKPGETPPLPPQPVVTKSTTSRTLLPNAKPTDPLPPLQGNSTWMNGMQWCIGQKMKVYLATGAGAGPGSNDEAEDEYANMSEEGLRQIAHTGETSP